MTQNVVHLRRVRAEIGDAYDADAEFTRHLDKLDVAVPWLERVMQESIRLAQQSITLRKVLQPCEIADELATYAVPAGTYIATLLSVTNTDAQVPSLAMPLGEFHPERFQGAYLSSELYPDPARYMISTFGHGPHACPGLKFATYVFKIVLAKYLSTFDFVPLFEQAHVPAGSVGAVARATQPCVVQYRRRDRAV